MYNSSRARQLLNNAGRHTGNIIGRGDDAIQAMVRDHILRLPNDGSQLPSEARQSHLRNLLGETMFRARPAYQGDSTAYKGKTGDAHDYLNLFGSRAVQAGGLTAAGYGLMQLTEAMRAYGSPADYPEPNQLSL